VTRNNGGFTLVKLIVIVAIISILVAIAVPSFTESMARQRMEGMANELSTDLQYAKSQSASINKSVSLVTSEHGYTVVSTSSEATTTYKSITLSSAISLTDAITVTFEPYRALPVTTRAIVITHSQTSASLQINIIAMGHIQICSPNSSFGGYLAC